MANPVVEDTTTASSTTGTSSNTVAKPFGLAVGDLMVAFQAFDNSSNQGFSTPAGWTLLETEPTSPTLENSGLVCYYKVADSGDVAASNFTFSFTASVDRSAVTLSRITGFAESDIFAGSEIDVEDPPANNTTPSYTTSLTPDSSESLILVAFLGNDGSLTGTPTISGYAITPTATFTELADIGLNPSGAGICLGVASADYDGKTEITNRTATFSQDFSDRQMSIAAVINAPQNVTADLGRVNITPSVRGVTASQVNVATDLGHVDTEVEVHGVTGKATAPTQWTNESKPDTDWTNESKS